jgi:hypothetical protein
MPRRRCRARCAGRSSRCAATARRHRPTGRRTTSRRADDAAQRV